MRLRYDLATHVDFNVNIKFYYVNESEQFIEILEIDNYY
jgi:hypothetical protein